MRALFIGLALFAVTPAHADAEVRNGADFVRITARPCEDAKVLEHIKAAGDDPLDYRKAVAEVGGAPFAACWKPMYDTQQIFLRYEDSDAGLIPAGQFKPIKEV